MRNWLKKGAALLLTGMVILAGSGFGMMQAQAASDNDTSANADTDVKQPEPDPGPSSTSDFLSLSAAYKTPTVTYGQDALIALPVVNYSTVPLKDVIVKAKISNLVSEWPFEPDVAGATKVIRNFPAYNRDKNVEEVRQDLGFNFKVRQDVKSGYYKLTFDVTYLRDNQVEKTELVTYVKAVGKEDSGSLDDAGNDAAKSSKPRIVVTGFETNPTQVYAGDIFTLTIHVKNTSKTAAVTNVLFDMQAKEEGKDADSKFAAFLPTSGASSVYVDSLAPGASKDLVIEMSAKADLSQKPYVLDVNMKYDAKEAVDLTDTASVSIPIYQEQRCELGDAEVMPSEITVNGQTNIMFSVYNTGKTTLYNVWVKFQGDSIKGGDTFLGTITSGATGNVDAMVTGVAPTMDDGKIKAVISYENESGAVSTMEKEIELFVAEEMMEDMSDPSMGMDGEMGMEEVQNGGNKLVVPIIIVVIVLLIVVIVVVKRIRKKKREKAELMADLEALDDIDNKKGR